MVLYLADAIKSGRLDYLTVFSITRYLQFKDNVDAILIADGYQDLIVPIVQ